MASVRWEVVGRGEASVVPICSQGAAIPQDSYDLISATGFGFDQEEFVVMERCGVCLDHMVRQVMIYEMALKGADDGVQVPFGRKPSFIAAPNHYGTITRRKYQRAAVARLLRHDGFVVHSVFKSGAGKSLYSLVKVPGIIKYTDDGCHACPFAESYGFRGILAPVVDAGKLILFAHSLRCSRFVCGACWVMIPNTISLRIELPSGYQTYCLNPSG